MMDIAPVLAAARALAFVREEPRDTNAGQAVAAMLQRTGLPVGHPWCAAFVAHVGHAAYGAAWPLPLTASCAALGEAAKAKKLLVTTPAPGDVFLLYYPKLGRFAHTGFVTAVRPDGTCETIEGNTNDGGSRDGWGVFARVRIFGPKDRFIRWHA